MRRPLNWIVIGFLLLIWLVGTGIWREVRTGTDRAAGAIELAPETTVQIRRDTDLERLLERPNPATSAQGVVLLGAVQLGEYQLDAEVAGLLADGKRKPL